MKGSSVTILVCSAVSFLLGCVCIYTFLASPKKCRCGHPRCWSKDVLTDVRENVEDAIECLNLQMATPQHWIKQVSRAFKLCQQHGQGYGKVFTVEGITLFASESYFQIQRVYEDKTCRITATLEATHGNDLSEGGNVKITTEDLPLITYSDTSLFFPSDTRADKTMRRRLIGWLRELLNRMPQ